MQRLSAADYRPVIVVNDTVFVDIPVFRVSGTDGGFSYRCQIRYTVLE